MEFWGLNDGLVPFFNRRYSLITLQTFLSDFLYILRSKLVISSYMSLFLFFRIRAWGRDIRYLLERWEEVSKVHQAGFLLFFFQWACLCWTTSLFYILYFVWKLRYICLDIASQYLRTIWFNHCLGLVSSMVHRIQYRHFLCRKFHCYNIIFRVLLSLYRCNLWSFRFLVWFDCRRYWQKSDWERS